MFQQGKHLIHNITQFLHARIVLQHNKYTYQQQGSILFMDILIMVVHMNIRYINQHWYTKGNFLEHTLDKEPLLGQRMFHEDIQLHIIHHQHYSHQSTHHLHIFSRNLYSRYIFINLNNPILDNLKHLCIICKLNCHHQTYNLHIDLLSHYHKKIHHNFLHNLLNHYLSL